MSLQTSLDMSEPQDFSLEGDDPPLLESGSDELDSSEEEDWSDITEGLSITKEEVLRNTQLLNGSMVTDPPVHTLSELRIKHPGAFSEESEEILASVLAENPLQYELSDYQVCDQYSWIIDAYISLSGLRHQLFVQRPRFDGRSANREWEDHHLLLASSLLQEEGS